MSEPFLIYLQPNNPLLKAAVAYYKNLGVTIASVMTDNGSCYVSHAFAKA